jgi:hypothetical protein
METLYSLACCSPLEGTRAPSGIAPDPIKTHRSAAGPNTPMACAPSRRWRVDHEILDEISPQDAIRGKPRETCPDARRRLGRRSARRFLHAAHTRDRANVRAATTRRSGRKHHGNISWASNHAGSRNHPGCGGVQRREGRHGLINTGGRGDVAVSGRSTRQWAPCVGVPEAATAPGFVVSRSLVVAEGVGRPPGRRGSATEASGQVESD